VILGIGAGPALRSFRRRGAVSERPADGTALLRELITYNHLEIGRADGKAAVLLTTAGSLLSLLLLRRPVTSSWTQPLWWCAVVSASGAALALLLALMPRRGAGLRDGVRLLAYFEDVVRAQKQALLSAALADSSRAQEARLVRALEGTSRIAHLKNRYVRWGVLLLLPAVAAVLPALTPGA
jgi:hypothetical protein